MFLQPNRGLLERLVGYVEYRRSILLLQELVRISSTDELMVADEMVRENDRYIAYANTEGRLTQMSNHGDVVPDGLAEDGKRHGLAWVMGLARVELGGMVGAVLLDDLAFQKMQLTPYELPAFVELLDRDTLYHCRSLQNDPVFRRMVAGVRGIPRSSTRRDTQTYAQRISMVQAMVQACIQFAGARYGPLQLAELRQWQNQLQAVRRGLFRLGEVQ